MGLIEDTLSPPLSYIRFTLSFYNIKGKTMIKTTKVLKRSKNWKDYLLICFAIIVFVTVTGVVIYSIINPAFPVGVLYATLFM